MAAVNAIRLPKESPFRKADPTVCAQTERQDVDSSDDNEGSESPISRVVKAD